MNRRSAIKLSAAGAGALLVRPDFVAAQTASLPFGPEYSMLETLTTGEWWLAGSAASKGPKSNPKARNGFTAGAPSMDVPRDQVVAFALYTVQSGVLKMTAQLYPLKPGEVREARLEVQRGGEWRQIAAAEVLYPGWDAHFRVEQWDATQDVPYRVRHGETAQFAGLVRKDPADKDQIVVANMSCNSVNTVGHRNEIVTSLRKHDPDVLFFSGDQTYRHTEHTAGWIEFGLQFREVIKDRPTICIPDDHDVGHGNVWGEEGKQSTMPGDADGGYRHPPEYVNQVQRQQSWHLPDPVDPADVKRGVHVYFTRMLVGGLDLAILEDRKFKTGPAGRIPKMGPRPDHINVPGFDPKSIDLPGLELLGKRQEKFLESWTGDWTGAEMKAVLSATAFCGAVHMHGRADARLLADLDCNGWPQTPRNRALTIMRRAWAVHLCGDQHLAVVVKHGITEDADGPYAFTSPALVNTYYHRWWHPHDEKPGTNPIPGSPLPWTGNYKDGLGNRITMLAYANPGNLEDERQRGDGYGLVRFNKSTRTIVFECWPRFCDVTQGDKAQYPGWPISFPQDAGDGRTVAGWLPELLFENNVNPVVQIIEDATGEILYTVRAQGGRFHPRVYSMGKHTIKIGPNKPDTLAIAALEPKPRADSGRREIKLQP